MYIYIPYHNEIYTMHYIQTRNEIYIYVCICIYIHTSVYMFNDVSKPGDDPLLHSRFTSARLGTLRRQRARQPRELRRRRRRRARWPQPQEGRGQSGEERRV